MSLLFAAANGLSDLSDDPTMKFVLGWAPLVVIGIMVLMLLDRRRDKLRGTLQEMSEAMKKLGLHQLPQLLDAIVRGDWEAAKGLWDGIKAKFGSADGVSEAAVEIIEETMPNLMKMDGNAKLRQRVEVAIEGVVMPMLVDDKMQVQLAGKAGEAGDWGFTGTQKLFMGLASVDLDSARDAFQALVTEVTSENGFAHMVDRVEEKAFAKMLRDPKFGGTARTRAVQAIAAFDAEQAFKAKVAAAQTAATPPA
jgi:hypothetical protein